MEIEKAKIIVEKLLETFHHAGDISLKLRKKGLIKKIKPDNTPVTNGDIEVNNILTKRIKELTPEIPIISEENIINISSENLNKFWLIDPIDGTYDYINNKEEFTLNAALIINKKPLIGIVNAPDKKRLFYSYGKDFSFEINNNKKIKLSCKKASNDKKIIAVSYSNNLKPKILELHKKFNVNKYVKMKSSLKFCVIAAGEFDLYISEPRASEWDIAAGHAVLENAGGIISDFNGNEIFYGKKDFKNPSIILKRSLEVKYG